MLNRIISNLRSNFGIKVKKDRYILAICMGISLIFWFLIKMSASYDTEKAINTSYEIPPNYAFVEMPPTKLIANIEGRGFDLMYEYFANSKAKALFDLQDEDVNTLNQVRIRNTIKDALTSSSINIANVNVNNIPLRLEERDEKKVPIRLREEISYESGYHLLENIVLAPDSVLLSGPASLVDSLDEWSTNLFDLKKLNQTVTEDLTLAISPWTGLKIFPEKTQITIPVEQLTEKSLFIPVIVNDSPDSLKIFPDKIRINAIVGLSDYNSINKDDFRAEVNLKGVSLNGDKNTAPIYITQQPEVVKSIYFTPKSVEFFIVKAEEARQ